MIWHAALGDHDPIGPYGWLATGLALAYTSVLGAILVHVAIAVSNPHRPPRLAESFGPQKLGELASGSFGLVAVYVISVDWRAFWMIAAVAAVLWIAHRSYDQARIRAESLEQVNRFTEAVGREVELAGVVGGVLDGVRRAFPAERAELRFARADGELEDWVADDDGVARRRARLLAALDGSLEEATLLGGKNPGVRELAELGRRDGMFVPLRSEGKVVGTLVLAGRVGDAEAFGAQDLRQLQALANHAAVAIDNALRADLILRQAAEHEHAALHDELTGLPNRRLFSRQVDEALGRSPASVLLVDLDNFRAVNDTLGHQVGDGLLRLASQRIQAAAADEAVVARLGGDEFAVLLPDADDLAARACASMIRSALTRTFDLDGLAVAVDASVGVAVAEQGADAATTLRHVDLALHTAKESRSGSAVFQPEMDRSDSSRLGLLAELRSAVAGNRLTVDYQPQVDLATGHVVGVEALARWRHPELGTIGPDEFVPLAEHSGLITPLTMLVLRTALQDAEQLQSSPGDFRVAVNISPRSLLDRGFVDEVALELERVTVPPAALTLEITESSLMTDPEQAVAALTRLRSIGVRLSVDDLGTGYSSLAYLLKLPVDEVKIDRSFVATLPDPAAEVVVGAIIDLGHRLHRQVVAEGIEDERAYDQLRELGCDLAQGYWMGRPMPLVELRSYLADRRPTRLGGLRRVL